jgi:hypothetical protein
MTVLLYLIVPALVVAAVVGMRVYSDRRPKSIEGSIKEFQRGLDALDPDADATRRRRGGNGG